MQVRYEEIISDSAYLDRILADGATKASDIADATLNNVYQAMGFLQRWAEPMLQEEFMWKRPNHKLLEDPSLPATFKLKAEAWAYTRGVQKDNYWKALQIH